VASIADVTDGGDGSEDADAYDDDRHLDEGEATLRPMRSSVFQGNG
jgi:hypothetical protein